MKPSVHALGNLTKTPVLEQTKNGVATCSFTVACNGFRENDTTFLWCRAYRETAENICKFLQKGSPIYVVGELSQYVSEKDKLSHTYCDVIRAQFVGGARREGPPPIDEERASRGRTEASEGGESEDASF